MATDGLSPGAIRLLAALRRRGFGDPSLAVTHRDLAAICGIPQRDIVDLADELLQSGILVVASCGSPPGCWLATTDQAREYDRSLRRRALRILIRRRHLRQAIARQRGQLALPLEPRASARAELPA